MMRLDLHVHSKYSYDSLLDVRTIIRSAVDQNLTGIAITDHNTIKGAQRALKDNKHSILIIPGSEMRTQIGEIIGLFLNEEIRSLNPLELIDEVKDQGGLAVLPHPFKGTMLTEGENDELIKKLDCVELLNSRERITSSQHRVLIALGKSLIAGSDAHFRREVGLCQTLIKANTLDLEEARKRLLLRDKILFCRKFSSNYNQELSQIIKSMKLHQYSSFLMRSMSLLRTVLKSV